MIKKQIHKKCNLIRMIKKQAHKKCNLIHRIKKIKKQENKKCRLIHKIKKQTYKNRSTCTRNRIEIEHILKVTLEIKPDTQEKKNKDCRVHIVRRFMSIAGYSQPAVL